MKARGKISTGPSVCHLCPKPAGTIGCLPAAEQDALTAQPVPSVLQLFLLLPCQQLKAVQPLREHTFEMHLHWRRRRRGGVSGTGVRVQQGGWSGAGQGLGRGMQAGGRSAAPRQQRGVQSGVHRAASRSRTVLRARTCCCSALPLAC